MLEVIPAYGRDFNTKKEVLASWDANQDFTIQTLSEYGRQINKQDWEANGKPMIQVYYANKLKSMIIG